MIIVNKIVSFCILVFKGIALLLNGLFSVIKTIVKAPFDIVIYAAKGIFIVEQSLWKIVSTVLKSGYNVFRTIFIFVWKILRTIVVGIKSGVFLITIKVWKILKAVGSGIRNGVVFIVMQIWKIFKLILDLISSFFLLAARGGLDILAFIFGMIFFVIKKIFRFIGFIIIYALYGFKLIAVSIFTMIKIIIENILKLIKFVTKKILILFKLVVKYVVKVISMIFKVLIKFVTLIFAGILVICNKVYRILYLIVYGIWTTIVFIFNAIIFLPKLIIKSIIHFVSNFKSTINNYILVPIQNAAEYVVRTFKIIKSRLVALPKDIKASILEWYNNLTFVKHMQNKRDMNRQVLLIDFNSVDAKRSDKKIVWQYYAKDENGKYIRGIFEAFSKLDVHSFLMSEGYEVYDIKTSKSIEFFYGGRNSISGKVKPKKLIFFLTQLSTYIRAGIPLTDSVRILARQEKNSKMQRLYQSIIYELIMGENFSKALEKQGDAFPKLLVNMLRTSEMTGELAETLDDMSEYYNSMYKLKKQTITSMMYPMIVLFFVLVVIVFIMVYVIPQFIKIYEDSDAELPVITVITIKISAFLQANLVFLIIGIILFIILMRFLYKKVKLFKTIIQWMVMHVPVVKNVIIYNEITMFTKTFSALLKHNVFITECMEILSKITNNEIYKMIVFDSISSIAKGDNISSSFKNHWAIPQLAYEMMLTGERTGQLPLMMGKVAIYYQEEQKNLVNQIKTLVEPLVIVILAITVGVILLAVVVPMFNLYSSLSSGV